MCSWVALTSSSVGQSGQKFFERSYVSSIVEVLVLGFQSKGRVNSWLSEMTLRVAHQWIDTVVIIQETSYIPTEYVQYMPESFSDQFVRAHHSGERRVLFAEVEALGLCTSSQNRDFPYTSVPSDWCYDIITNRSQKSIWKKQGIYKIYFYSG